MSDCHVVNNKNKLWPLLFPCACVRACNAFVCMCACAESYTVVVYGLPACTVVCLRFGLRHPHTHTHTCIYKMFVKSACCTAYIAVLLIGKQWTAVRMSGFRNEKKNIPNIFASYLHCIHIFRKNWRTKIIEYNTQMILLVDLPS